MATANVLALLDLLQSRPTITGRELAQRLEVDGRTVRRYIAALQDLGIPVEGERGAGGGYRLRPGFRLPPMMFDDDEAAVVVLALVTVRRLGLGDPGHVEAALAKLRRVLPAPLRMRAEALDAALGLTVGETDAVGVPGTLLLRLADAVHRRRRVRLTYTARDGTTTEREVSPHGLVAHGGRWYLSAFDHTRDAPRTLRVDRIRAPTTTPEPAVEQEDAVAHVTRAFATLPWRWACEVVLELAPADARRRIPPTLASLEPVDATHTRLLLRADSLDWAASVLAGLDCPFAIVAPDELRTAVGALAQRLAARAQPTG